jgi:hypothetical protein
MNGAKYETAIAIGVDEVAVVDYEHVTNTGGVEIRSETSYA